MEPLIVPEEFLDAITVEIMTQPIRLPCGLAVDSITLEKYYEEEAKFGRLPNDPFTGICFTETLKPLADSALKGRVDKFLSQNCDEPSLKNIPRVLGGFRNKCISTAVPFRNPNFVDMVAHTANLQSYLPEKYVQDSSMTVMSPSKLFGKMEGCTKSATVVREVACLDPHLPVELLSAFSSDASRRLSMHEMKCKDCVLPMTRERSSYFYMGNCHHIFLCRKCLVKIEDKQALKICEKCGSKWRANACIRVFL